ncbi:MAG: hypothetical protein ACI4GO_04940, partial [Hominenteromicrobium sp.]
FNFENPYKWGFSGGRNDQVAVKFRVRPVMTASIRFRIQIRRRKPRVWAAFRSASYFIGFLRKSQAFSAKKVDIYRGLRLK